MRYPGGVGHAQFWSVVGIVLVLAVAPIVFFVLRAQHTYAGYLNTPPAGFFNATDTCNGTGCISCFCGLCRVGVNVSTCLPAVPYDLSDRNPLCNGTWTVLEGVDCKQQLRSTLNWQVVGRVFASYLGIMVVLLLFAFLWKPAFAFLMCGDPMNEYQRL